MTSTTETFVTDASWILRGRAPDEAELRSWAGQAESDGTGTLAQIFKDGASIAASKPPSEQVKLLYKAALGDFTREDPIDLAFWTAFYTTNSNDVNQLAAAFMDIARSGFRSDPSGLPVDPTRKFQSLAGRNDDSVVLSHGTDRHLYCIRRNASAAGGWEQIDLGAMIDASEGAYVSAWTARQESDGSFRLALAIGNYRTPHAAGTLHLAGPVSDDPVTMDWNGVMAAARSIPVPDVEIERVSLAPDEQLQWGDLIITGTNTGTRENYRIQLSGAQPHTDKLPIPENAEDMLQLEPGGVGRGGIWYLYHVGGQPELLFTTFLDQFGKTLNIPFTVPPAAAAFAIIPAGDDGRDSAIVAGQDIILCHGADAPVTIVSAVPDGPVKEMHGTRDVIRYIAGNTLYEVTRQGDTYTAPRALPGEVAAMQSAGSTGPAADAWYVTPDRRLTRHRDGAVAEVATLDAVWTVKPPSRATLDEMLARSAPVLHFESDENHHPSAVELYLAKAGLRQKGANFVVQPGGLGNGSLPQLLPTLPRTSAATDRDQVQYFLEVPDDAMPQVKGGDPDHAVFYARAKFKETDDETHVQVWLFYPYNGPGTATLDTLAGDQDHIDLAPLGEHEGDWEHATLIFNNADRSLKGIFVSQHAEGAMVAADQLGRDEQTGRPKLYASRNGHAIYPAAGTNEANGFSQGSLVSFALRNDTDDGLRIDSGEAGRLSLVSAQFLTDSRPAEPPWLEIPYRWGRCIDFTAEDFKKTFSSIMTSALPIAALVPLVNVIYPILMAVGPSIAGQYVADHDSLRDEGHSGGPTGPKQKGNWFGAE
jgi:hypothetical protein